MGVISVRNVVKKFGEYRAVSNVSFEVEKGTVFGLLGPNGAGKTTTIRMLTNILMADEGEILINGEKVNSEHQNIIGYLPEERGLYKKLKVIEQLVYFGQLKGLSRQNADKEARRWLAKLDAAGWEKKKIQELSKGMQQKVQFIATILHNPDVLILDEPFSGFDPVNVDTLKHVLLDLKDLGKTIILSTHVMEQVEQLCDSICLIDKGKAALTGEVREIKSRYGNDTVLICYEGDDSFLDELQNIKFINRTKNRVEFRFEGGDATARNVLRSAVEKVEINKFEILEPSLREIFIDVVSGKEKN